MREQLKNICRIETYKLPMVITASHVVSTQIHETTSWSTHKTRQEIENPAVTKEIQKALYLQTAYVSERIIYQNFR